MGQVPPTPKPPWTTAKVSAEKLDAMLTMIAGFEVVIDRASAKHKLAQNRNAVDHAGVVRGLEARGDAASLAIAARMKAR